MSVTSPWWWQSGLALVLPAIDVPEEFEMIQDHVTAVMEYLKADSDIVALVGTRVFGIELPELETNFMPRKAIVIKQSGGDGSGGYLEHSSPRIDIFCYGETPHQARTVRREVFDVLKQLIRTVTDSTLINSISPEGGPLDLRDPDTQWPVVFESYQVFAGESPVSSY